MKKRLVPIVAMLLLAPVYSIAGDGLSVWDKLGAGTIADADMFPITDVSDTTQSAEGSSKTATAAQVAAYVATKITDATLTTTDVTTNNASTSKHGWFPKLTAPSSGYLNVYGLENGETAATAKGLFDATVPSTQAAGDSAATGSAMSAARRDHKHAMPAAQTATTTSFTPNGSIESTTVQTAIQEVRNEAGGGGYTNLTSFVAQTPWRIFYSDGSGDVKEAALGANGEYFKSNGESSVPGWATPSGAAHDAVTLDTETSAIFTLSTQQIILDSQTANYVLAAPNGSAGDPTFRALVAADIPSLSYQAADADLTTWAGVTPGTGVATFLATPTSSNFFTAVTGEGAFAATLFGYADAAAVLAGIGAQAADADLTDLADGSLPGSKVGITDSGNYFTGTDAEAVLQELGAKLPTGVDGNRGLKATENTIDYSAGEAGYFVYTSKSGSPKYYGGVTEYSLATVNGALGTPSFTAVNLPTSDADPSTTAGQIRHDTTITGLTGGALKYWNGTNARILVDLDTAPSNDDYVVTYDADADKFYMKADATGAGGSGSMTTVKEADTQVGGADIVTLDFGAGFDLAETPDTEVQITFDPAEVTVWDLGGATSVEVPNGNDVDTDAEGEISWDANGDWLRIHDGTNQVAVARAKECYDATVVKPNDLADATRDAFRMWQNNSGMSFIITSWSAQSSTDNTDLNIETTTNSNGTNATVDAVSITTDGTSMYYASDSTITAGTIANGSILWLDFDDTDDPGWVSVSVCGYYDGNVN